MSFPAGEYPLHPPPPPATAAAATRRRRSSLPPSTQSTMGCGFGAAKEPMGGAPTPLRPARAPTPARNIPGACPATARVRAHTVAGIASTQRLSLKRTLSGLYKGGGGSGGGASSSTGSERRNDEKGEVAWEGPYCRL